MKQLFGSLPKLAEAATINSIDLRDTSPKVIRAFLAGDPIPGLQGFTPTKRKQV